MNPKFYIFLALAYTLFGLRLERAEAQNACIYADNVDRKQVNGLVAFSLVQNTPLNGITQFGATGILDFNERLKVLVTDLTSQLDHLVNLPDDPRFITPFEDERQRIEKIRLDLTIFTDAATDGNLAANANNAGFLNAVNGVIDQVNLLIDEIFGPKKKDPDDPWKGFIFVINQYKPVWQFVPIPARCALIDLVYELQYVIDLHVLAVKLEGKPRELY